MQVNEQDALKFFNSGKERIILLDDGKKWFIPSFVEFQYGLLNSENRAHQSVISLLLKEGVNKGLIRGLQGRKDMDKDKDMDKEKEKKTDFMESLRLNPAYSHIDIDTELGKMDTWLLLPKAKGRKKTHSFIFNWLNKIEKPIEAIPVKVAPKEPSTLDKIKAEAKALGR